MKPTPQRRLRVLCLSVMLALAAGVSAPPSGAQMTVAEAQERVDRAQALMAKGQAQAAYELLATLVDALAGDPGFDYLFGIAALDSGHATEAVFALERAVAVDPENSLARAELARAYLAVNDVEESKQEFELVRADADVPAEVRTAIDRYLDALSRPAPGETTDFRGYLGLSVGYDSNVNSATDNDQISIGGLSFRLDSSGKETADVFTALQGGLSITHPLRRNLDLNAGVSAQHRIHESEHTFETTTFSGTAGLSYRYRATTFTAGLQVQHFAVHADANRNSLGAIGQVMHDFSQRSRGGLFVQYARLTYPPQPVRDADRYVGGATYTHALNLPWSPILSGRVFAGIEAQDADARDDLGHTVLGAVATAQIQPLPNVRAFAQAGYDVRNYGEEPANLPLRLGERRDEQLQLVLGASYEPVPSWTINPVLLFTRNVSNVPIYDYKRGIASVSLLKSFD